MYPIPSQTSCYIEWNNARSVPNQIALYTTDGRLLHSKTFDEDGLNDNRYEIELDELARGIYWLQINLPEGRVFERILKM